MRACACLYAPVIQRVCWFVLMNPACWAGVASVFPGSGTHPTLFASAHQGVSDNTACREHCPCASGYVWPPFARDVSHDDNHAGRPGCLCEEELFRQYSVGARVNINVRQVLAPGQVLPL